MKIPQYIVRNTLYLGFGHALSGLLSILAAVYLARTQGAEKFGILSFAESTFLFFSLIAIWGSDFIGAREIANNGEHRHNTVGVIMPMRIIFAAGSFLLLVIFALIIRNYFETKIMIIIYGLTIFSSFFLLDWFYWGLEKFNLYVYSAILRDLAFLLLVGILVHIKSNFLWFGFAFVASRVLSNFYLLRHYFKHHGSIKMEWNFYKHKEFISSCNLIFFASLIGWVIHFFDIALISVVYKEKMAGYYSAAYRPLFFLLMGIVVYLKAIFPSLSKSKSSNFNEFKNIIVMSIHLLLLLFIPLVALGAIFSKQIITFLYGNGFVESIGIFRILVFILLSASLNITFSRALIAAGKEKENFKANVVVGTSNILLNLCLVPLIGISGAAFSKLGAECVGLIYYSRKIHKLFSL